MSLKSKQRVSELWAFIYSGDFQGRRISCCEFQLFLISEAATDQVYSKSLRKVNSEKEVTIKDQSALTLVHPAVPVAAPDFDGNEKCQNLL